ncbi:MAG: YkgJ family cysteine cluster protein [Deltaproteobacteria bacterium]|nr:YkgJ family cysteine cluster protein [Deltaproteobacteria bacterium]
MKSFFSHFWTLIKRLPAFFLWVFAFMAGMMIYYSDRLAAYLLKHQNRTEYLLKGGCAQTGQCCQAIALELPKSWVASPKIRRFFLLFYQKVFNFHFLGVNEASWLIFECHYLRPNQTCGIYPFRPKLCREFPLIPFKGHGRLHKGCGFWFAKKSDLGGFGEKLAQQMHEKEREDYLRSLKAS